MTIFVLPPPLPHNDDLCGPGEVPDGAATAGRDPWLRPLPVPLQPGRGRGPGPRVPAEPRSSWLPLPADARTELRRVPTSWIPGQSESRT